MPDLIIIAGCNGAGKSTFAPSFLPAGLTSFDYDAVYLKHYISSPDSEFREKMAKDMATKQFEKAIDDALSEKMDFCYETNFDVHPVFWADKFRGNGFTLNLIFFCLENQSIARHRILVRTEFKGLFIDDKTIDLKWKAGYKNLNIYYTYFDNILIVDNSRNNEVYQNILQIKKGVGELMTNAVPGYFRHRLPDIYKLAIKTKDK